MRFFQLRIFNLGIGIQSIEIQRYRPRGIRTWLFIFLRLANGRVITHTETMVTVHSSHKRQVG